MGFNPLEEKGTPIDEQLHSWSDLKVEPYDKNMVHPYTRTRVILMNGIEVEAAIFGHQFNRHTDDVDLKKTLAMSRRIEQQQQKMINWLTPGDESTIEVTLGYEQVAVDLTAWLAQNEPDPYVKGALDFALLEDFDHLYRYANLYAMTEGKKGENVVKNLTEITPGRPTYAHHRHPFDTITKHIDKNTADIKTKLHIHTIVAGEQQTMNFYMNVGNRAMDVVGRSLYQEIGMVEEEHVTHYESLQDPTATWMEMWLMHEYNECYLYYSFMTTEVDPRIKRIWESHLMQEIEHLKIACSMMQKYEKRDPLELLPKQIPETMVFQSNIDYVRKILESQVDFVEHEGEFVAKDRSPDNSLFEMYQKAVNNGRGFIPSQQVIEDNIRDNQRDYRLEAKGPNPVKRLQAREKVTI